MVEITLEASGKLWQAGQQDDWGRERSDADAEFIGWQETQNGEVIALYVVITRKHILFRSTVTEQTLRANHLEVPPTLHPQGQLKRYDHER